MIIHLLKNDLDRLHRAFDENCPPTVIESFTVFLHSLEKIRASQDRNDWVAQAADIRRHPVFPVLCQCPMTKHSFEKPRGYPGDAALLDWIYYPKKNEAVINDSVSRYLYHHNARRPAPSAVRARVKHIAEIIDDVPAGGSMLALACGHFRESELSRSIREGKLSRIDVVDQDPISLRLVNELGIPNLTAREANVMKFPTATSDSPRYDLVYAAGLFDYFSPKMAQRVAKRLWTHVAPGGTLCIPNFNQDIPDAGYLECFMDWWLVYRSRAEMLEIGEAIPQDTVADLKCELRDQENIWYLHVRREPSFVTDHALRVDSGTETTDRRSTTPMRLRQTTSRRQTTE